jgi:hypothetical protein
VDKDAKGRFAKGHEKRGGIQKGTVHRKTRVELACEAVGVDPFQVLASIAHDEEHPDRTIAAKELAKYLEPQKKAVEHSGVDGESLVMKVEIVDYSREG